MERRYNMRPRVPGNAQTSNTSKSQHHVPPPKVPPSSDVHSLRQALLSAEEHNMKLASENTALKQQFAGLQNENQKLVHENRSLQRTLGRKLHMAKQTICDLQKALASVKPGQYDSKRQETDREKKEIFSLQQSLSAQKEETAKVRDSWKKECDRLKAAFEEQLKMVKSKCDNQRSSDLQEMQAECERKVSQLQEKISEKDNEISTLRSEIERHTEENVILSAQLSFKDAELNQSITNYNDLDQTSKKELEEREESWARRQKESEKLWAECEDALVKKASQAEEELKSVIVKSIHLQELVLKKKQKRKRDLWSRKRETSSSVEEEATEISAQAGEGETTEEEKDKKKNRRDMWGRKMQRSNSDKEASACQARVRQEEDTKEKKRSHWSWASMKKSSPSNSRVEEDDGQQ